MEQSGIPLKKLLEEYDLNLRNLYSPREIRRIFNLLCAEYAGWDSPLVHLSLDYPAGGETEVMLRRALTSLMKGQPLQYLLGKTWFGDLVLKVDPSVLIPRPETEEMCMRMMADPGLKHSVQPAVLDIGTGSGCIAISLKKALPVSRVTALDKSAGALEVAMENARSNQCDITFLLADILEEEQWSRFGMFDLIAGNPPYVTQSERQDMDINVLDYEPEMALYVPDDNPLLFYHAIAKFSVSHLLPGGILWLEINERFGRDMAALLTGFGFSDVQVLQDIMDKDRFARAVLGSV